jgi:hypothetical protein
MNLWLKQSTIRINELMIKLLYLYPFRVEGGIYDIEKSFP